MMCGNRKWFIFPFLVIVVWLSFMIINDNFSVFKEGWKASVTMIFGAFIAGASSEGGGAVAFPVFTLLLDLTPSIARNFSVAIQSIGMTAASLIIIFSKVKIEKRVILFSLLGGFLGLVIGTFFIEPYLSPKFTKLFFVSLWLSFGITLSVSKFNKKDNFYDVLPSLGAKDKIAMLSFGFLGGIITSFFGNGIDILTFCFATLFFRLNVKVATASSVIIMAILSIFSFALHVFVINDFTGEVVEFWLSSIPVVVIFAPLGAILVTYVSNRVITNFLKIVILVQYIGAVLILNPSFNLYLLFSLLIVISGVVIFSYISIKGGQKLNLSK